MSLSRSLGWGLVLTLAAILATAAVGFVAGTDVSIPGILEMSSSSPGERPATEAFFNPLALLALVVVFGLVVRSATSARNSRQD
jgi:hypothetical protein